jgi:hypothetical protein
MSFEQVMSVPATDPLTTWPLYHVTAVCSTVYIHVNSASLSPKHTHTQRIDSSYMVGVWGQIQHPRCIYNEHDRLRRRGRSTYIHFHDTKKGLIHSLCSLSLDRSIASSEASFPESTISCFHFQVPVTSSFLTVI